MPDLRTSLYVRVEWLVTRMTSAVRILHEGWWLGVLDHQHLRQVTQRQYDRWRHFQDEDYNLTGLKPWELSAIEDHFQDCKTILLGAAGGGREVIALARLGFRVTAFECAAPLVDSCSALVDSEGVEAKVLHAEPDSVPNSVGIFEGVIVGWGGYMHIPSRIARVRFLRQIHSHTRPGGPVLLSYFVRNAVSRHFRWKAAIARANRRLRFSSDPVEVGDSLQLTFDHWFTEEEIRSELEEAGFEPVFLASEPYGHAVGIAR